NKKKQQQSIAPDRPIYSLLEPGAEQFCQTVHLINDEPQRFTSKFLSYWNNGGTLHNGGVFVARSTLPGPGQLGLFAGQDFKEGDIITEYVDTVHPTLNLLQQIWWCTKMVG